MAGVLAVTMLISSNSVFATTTAEYDEQIESIKSQQAENEAEAERLNEKLDSLRDQTSEAEAYQATLEEQITTYQTSIDLAVQNITQLNTNITNLEAEIKKADEEYADTFAELKVRLRSLYASGGNLTTLQTYLIHEPLRFFHALRGDEDHHEARPRADGENPPLPHSDAGSAR